MTFESVVVVAVVVTVVVLVVGGGGGTVVVALVVLGLAGTTWKLESKSCPFIVTVTRTVPAPALPDILQLVDVSPLESVTLLDLCTKPDG